MTLQLDARQRAMLREMGIELFWPQDTTRAEAADEARVVAPAPLQRSTPARPAAAPAARPQPVPADPAVDDRSGRAAQPVLAEAPLRQPLAGVPAMEWEGLAAAVRECRACGLCESRTQTVFGVGDRRADWMVVGEAPGENEDLQGEPFVGQAGKLLDNMLAALGVGRRQGVYIANVLKCRPPGNRNPQPEEIAQCEPFLRRQVELLQPKIILAMGRFAIHTLLQTGEPVGKLRGRVYRYNDVPVVVTYHPAYLLRNLPDKAKAWADLCLARQVLAQRS